MLLRPNAIFAAPLLAAYVIWPARFDLKRAALLFLPAVAAGYALVHVTYYGVLDVKRENPLHSLMVFDLGGITHFSGENQFPVTWSARGDRAAHQQVLRPGRWDCYWTIEPCRFVMQRLERKDDKLFGTPRLVEAWRRAVLAHPLAYLQHRATFIWTFPRRLEPHARALPPDDPAKTPLAERPPVPGAGRAARRAQADPAVPPRLLARAGDRRSARSPGRCARRLSGAFAVGVTGSAVVYVLTFFLFGVAAGFPLRLLVRAGKPGRRGRGRCGASRRL